MPSIVEKQLESRRSEPLEHQIDRSDHSRHIDLRKKSWRFAPRFVFSGPRASNDQIERFDAREALMRLDDCVQSLVLLQSASSPQKRISALSFAKVSLLSLAKENRK